MPRYLFFSGKGGVGKTSLASAAAVILADRGERTLLVTTDPASNLADVFEQSIGPSPVAINGLSGLLALEIDAAAAAQAYRERALAPLQGMLPQELLRSIDEQMAGPCTEEIAGFDRFVACLAEPGFDRVVFDTAPTGHTLRLLELPTEWSEHIAASARGSGQTCLGPVEALTSSREQYDRAMALLRSTSETGFALVSQAERTAVEETVRAERELTRLGIHPQVLFVNGLIPPDAADNDFFRHRRAMQERQISELRDQLSLPVLEIPLLDLEIRGLPALRKVGEFLDGFPLLAA